MNVGAVSKRRIDAKSRPGLVDECLGFFGVASPDEWRTHYLGMECDFRRSRADQCDIGAISAWLRLGEQEAEKLDTPSYDRSGFEAALDEIRALTVEPPEVFEPPVRAFLPLAATRSGGSAVERFPGHPARDPSGLLLPLADCRACAFWIGVARRLRPGQ